jgi:SAM-dependent methyltransferase
LPFDSQSVDLLVLPHGLEASTHPHQVLREVERVLVPEGRLVISGFNPWSLWGVRQHIPYLTPWLPQSIHDQVSLPRLKDWLKLLSFDIELGHFGCYVPPFRSQKWINRFAFTEAAGNRWWPVCGAVYVVSAVKRVAGMRLITPRWKTASSLRKGARQPAGAALQQKTPITQLNQSNNQ